MNFFIGWIGLSIILAVFSTILVALGAPKHWIENCASIIWPITIFIGLGFWIDFPPLF